MLGNYFWREGFEAAFGPGRMGEKGGCGGKRGGDGGLVSLFTARNYLFTLQHFDHGFPHGFPNIVIGLGVATVVTT